MELHMAPAKDEVLYYRIDPSHHHTSSADCH